MKLITYNDIYSELAKHGKYGFGFLCGGTSVRPDNIIIKVMEHVKPKVAVEIGTYRGLSTTVIASACDKVYTFDIKYWEEDTEFLWNTFKVRDRIFYNIVKSNFDKKYLLYSRNFNFAYIDGNHSIEDAKYDFEITKKCDHVLFDDADGIAQFLKTINSINITKRFAYWSADGNYNFVKDIQDNLDWKEIEINGRMDKMEWGRVIMRKEGLTKEEFKAAWQDKK